MTYTSNVFVETLLNPIQFRDPCSEQLKWHDFIMHLQYVHTSTACLCILYLNWTAVSLQLGRGPGVQLQLECKCTASARTSSKFAELNFGRATVKLHLLSWSLSMCFSVTLVSHAKTVQDIEIVSAPYVRGCSMFLRPISAFWTSELKSGNSRALLTV